jgi:hypothetical protein
MAESIATERLIEKLKELPEDRLVEVEDFIDFLRQRHDDRALVSAATGAAEPAFAAVWNNPDDAAYDEL